LDTVSSRSLPSLSFLAPWNGLPFVAVHFGSPIPWHLGHSPLSRTRRHQERAFHLIHPFRCRPASLELPLPRHDALPIRSVFLFPSACPLAKAVAVSDAFIVNSTHPLPPPRFASLCFSGTSLSPVVTLCTLVLSKGHCDCHERPPSFAAAKIVVGSLVFCPHFGFPLRDASAFITERRSV